MPATVEEHARLIRTLIGDRLLGTEAVPIAEALGRVLAEDVVSPVELPLFRNSQMDGFAVRSDDAVEGATLRVIADIPAGPSAAPVLGAGEAARIMTGALVPEGADAVIPVEQSTVTRASTGAETVTLRSTATAGLFIREPGSDLHAGATILPDRLRVGSRHIAALAAAGVREVTVLRRPRVASISTGSELADVPGHGQIFDANLPALTAAITAAGGVPVVTGRVADDHEEFRDLLGRAVAAADVVVTSGGISMGDYEVVREVLEPLGATVTTIAMQPGGPQGTASIEGVPVLCFPGNPVSTQLSFELFLAPLIREAAGTPPAVRGRRTLVEALRSVPGKRQFLRGRFVGVDAVELASGASSHLVAGLAAADCLIDVPAETVELAAGAVVETVEL